MCYRRLAGGRSLLLDAEIAETVDGDINYR